MLFEIEFLAVGERSRAGDAIVIRYGEINNYQLLVVDGGTAETGEKLVEHLKTQFGKDVRLEHVVLTHADADHASGLRDVLREIPVANVWLHIPWFLSEEAIHLFKNKNWTKNTLAAAIKNGGRVLATQGVNKVHWGGFPVRNGYTTAKSLSFSSEVEAYD